MKRSILEFTFDYTLAPGVFLNCLKPSERIRNGIPSDIGNYLYIGITQVKISRYDAAKLIRDFRKSGRKEAA